MSSTLPKPVAPYGDEIPVEKNEGYRLIRYRANYRISSADRQKDQEFKINGDTLRVLEIIGPDKLAIATSSKGRRYPFLPIEEGMEITRPYDRIFVRLLSSRGTTAQAQSVGEALFLSSFGKVLSPAQEKPTGLFAGFASAQGTATTVGVDLFREAFVNGTFYYGGAAWPYVAAFLKYGGLFRVKNTSPGLLYLYHGSPAQFTSGSITPGIPTEASCWPIDPGATEEFRVEGLLSTLRHNILDATPAFVTACLATAAGTGTYVVMVNRYMVDGSDLESGVDPETVTELE